LPVDDSPAVRERVLVVDDDPPLRRMLARPLTAEGFAVSVAADGAGALIDVERSVPLGGFSFCS